MQKTKRMAEEAKRMGQETQEGARSGFEAASKSFSEANRGFQDLAAEMMSYSKAAFDDAMRTWEQLIGVKSIEQAVEIQSQYAKRVYDNHMAELSKLREMYTDIVRDSSKPIEETTRRSR